MQQLHQQPSMVVSRMRSLRVCVMLLVAAELILGQTDRSLDDQWEQWKITHERVYKDEVEEKERKMIWRQNRHMIQVHNQEAAQGKHSYTLELNHWGDAGSLDIEVLEEMVERKTNNDNKSEIFEEVSDMIADFDHLTPKLILKRMLEVLVKTDNMSKDDILEIMTEEIVGPDAAIRKLILKQMEEMLDDYDKQTKKQILETMRKTLSEFHRMSRKLILDSVTAKMESGRMSTHDILGDMVEATERAKSLSRKLILEELEKMLDQHNKTDSTDSLPRSVDFREEGLVTRVRDQGTCGSCWAFSAAGALEGQLAKMTGQLLELSPQNLVDCDPENKGCNGGYMSLAFKYVTDNAGVNAENDYPYAGKKQNCSYNPSAVAAQCKGFRMVPRGDEQALAETLFRVGPLSVAINVQDWRFQFYKTGVYYNPGCSAGDRDHAMLLVGYGETATRKKYWIAKNSWGQGWGEGGYVRIARNRRNHCGIASEASYPLIWARGRHTELG